jgi:IMP dehydrogenase
MMNQDIPLALSYDDVLLVPQYSDIQSRSLVDISSQITPNVTLKLPLISINMNDVTGIQMAETLGLAGALGFLPRFDSVDVQAKMVKHLKDKSLQAAAAIGVKEGFMDRAQALVQAGAVILTIDVAHGHMQSCIDAVKRLKNEFGNTVDIIPGVIATYEAAEDLFKAGADSVRVGVGPGSICITRIVTGVGVPQITAIMEASRAARKYKKTVLADGGIKNSGDAAKALAAGASAVVMGNQFAGTDEAPGDIVEIEGIPYKRYNASTSLAEKTKHTKSLQDTGSTYLKHIEGVESVVPYKGPVGHVLTTFEYNIKSALSYTGAHTIPEFWEKARFVRVTPQALRENGAHDVITSLKI